MSAVIAGARILDPEAGPAGAVGPEGWVRFDGGVVVEVGAGLGADAPAHAADDMTDASALAGPGALLVPGFVDIHVHGGGGAAAEDGADGVRRLVAAHTAHGTTRFVISLVSAPIPVLVERVRAVRAVADDEPAILGVHLEGPFLQEERRGAHDPAALRAPDDDAVEALVAAAGAGFLRQVTIAPELPGAMAAIRRFRAHGVRVAVGHTNADRDTARAAFDAGATILTHAFNAMPPLLHRDPGPIGAAIADERVTIEVIADGVHVDPVVLRVLFAAAPGRVALVTDAMAAAGVGDGDFDLGGLRVVVSGGVARLADDPGHALAGSTLTMDAAVRGAVSAGVPLADAVRAATLTPAGAVASPADQLGRLEPGAPADAVLLTAAGDVAAVWRAGRRVA